jgi:hypothetical protein
MAKKKNIKRSILNISQAKNDDGPYESPTLYSSDYVREFSPAAGTTRTNQSFEFNINGSMSV